jgi:hypothetical protein
MPLTPGQPLREAIHVKSIKVLFVVSILGLNAVACDDDSSSNNSNTDMAAVIAKCKGLCAKENTGTCFDMGVTTVDGCNASCDEGGTKTATAECTAASAAYLTCADGLADVCARYTACSSELAAVVPCLQ